MGHPQTSAKVSGNISLRRRYPYSKKALPVGVALLSDEHSLNLWVNILKILSVKKAAFSVGAVVHEKQDGSLSCQLLEDLANIEASNEASAQRLGAYFARVAELGPRSLSTDQCHQVDAENKIYEFIAGRLRVLFFNGTPGSVVLCTHMFLKKTRKTPTAEVKAAIRAKDRYEADLAAGHIEWKEEL